MNETIVKGRDAGEERGSVRGARLVYVVLSGVRELGLAAGTIGFPRG